MSELKIKDMTVVLQLNLDICKVKWQWICHALVVGKSSPVNLYWLPIADSWLQSTWQGTDFVWVLFKAEIHLVMEETFSRGKPTMAHCCEDRLQKPNTCDLAREHRVPVVREHIPHPWWRFLKNNHCKRTCTSFSRCKSRFQVAKLKMWPG